MASLLEDLVGRYQVIAVHYLTARVRDADLARDLFQEVVRAILESGKAFESLDHLRNYFFAALRNAAVDHARAQARSRQVRLNEEGDAAAIGSLQARAAEAPQSRVEAEEELREAERRVEALRAALRDLPPQQRDLITQRFWLGKTFREIREATGTAISTLKSQEDAALEKLKKLIGKAGAKT